MSSNPRGQHVLNVPQYTPGVFILRNNGNINAPSQMSPKGVPSTGRGAYTPHNPLSSQRTSASPQGPFQSINDDFEQPRLTLSKAQSSDEVSHASFTAGVSGITNKRPANDYLAHPFPPQRPRHSNEALTKREEHLQINQQQEMEHHPNASTPPTSSAPVASSDFNIQVKKEPMEYHHQHDREEDGQYLLPDDLAVDGEFLETMKEKEEQYQAMQERASHEQISSPPDLNRQSPQRQIKQEDGDHFQHLEQARDISRHNSPKTELTTATGNNLNKLHLMKSLNFIRQKMLDYEVDLFNYLHSH